jgi:2-polyprenyl-3-methyl-5-hydroxy-6-metoxy-1,4-benzoquinol methylase
MSQHDNYTRDVLPGEEEALSRIVSKILPKSIVLDVGCGSGML